MFVFLIRSSLLMSGNMFKSQSKLDASRQRTRRLFAVQEIIYIFFPLSNAVFHPFEIVWQKVLILTQTLIAFALGIWSNFDFQRCFCVYEDRLSGSRFYCCVLSQSDALDVVIFGKQVFCWVTLGPAMFLWQQWQRDAGPNTASPPIERARLQIPIQKHRSANICEADTLCYFWRA